MHGGRVFRQAKIIYTKQEEFSVNSVVLILLAIAIFVVAYLTYGRYLAKTWGIDPKRKTPAYELEDGVDYCPAKTPVLMGHHFSSIAGAGPINGPIQAAFFGWLPCFLWIVIGGIFFGAVQDFGSIFVSIRHEGKSLGEVIEENIGRKSRVLFTVFAWLVLLLVIAAFADIVANSFTGSEANGSVATASLLFIPLAIAFGFFVYRKNAPMVVASVIGVILLAACVAIGLAFPIVLSKNFWLAFVFIYIMIASVTPVWILLQPRDYLSSFLLYFMMIAAVVGIFAAHPAIEIPAFIGFHVGNNYLFPTLFITIACGAISGFHSLIGSGTTSKQLDNEKDALLVGYGSMLIECVLAVISLIAVANVFNTISTNIQIRRRELAMLRSVGMSEQGFDRMMNFECFFYGTRTLLFGVPIAGLLSWLIYKAMAASERMEEFSWQFPWKSITISILGVFCIVFLTMLYATSKIRKENIIDALRDDMT